MSGRFWISLNGGDVWREVTEGEYLVLQHAVTVSQLKAVEMAPAAAAFGRGPIRGTQFIPATVMRDEGFPIPFKCDHNWQPGDVHSDWICSECGGRADYAGL